MKGNKKVLIIALLLLLISVSFTTYAIYRTSIDGTGTVTAANWKINFKNGSGTVVNTLNFTASDITWTNIPSAESGKIAPGATGTITFTIDATGSEVDVFYLAELGANAPAGFSISVPSSTETLIPYSASNMTADVTLTVTWNGALTDDEVKDSRDISLSSTDITIPITITARQRI